MGQKVNPNIFRLGITKSWKSEFFEKTLKELPRYTFKDLEIKYYLERFFNKHGIFVCDYRQNFHNSSLNVYLSYFITPYFFNKTKTKKKIEKIFLINNKTKTKKVIFKIQNFMFMNFKHKKKNKRKVIKKIKNLKLKLFITKINKYLIRNNYLKSFVQYLFKNIFENIKRGLLTKFLKTINLFVKNNYNIIFHFCCLNKETKKFLIKSYLKKKIFFELKKFHYNPFYKHGAEILLNCIINKNSASLLSKFIGFHVRSEKRHKFFLSFVKNFLKLLINKNIFAVKGVKFKVKGRINGARKAKQKIVTIGDVPVQSINSFLDYSQTAVHNKNGAYGIKVWVF